MTFASEFLGALPDKFMPWPESTIQIIGIALFMVAVIIHMVTMQVKDIRKENGKPRLILQESYTEFKEAFSGEGEQREKIGAWYFVIVKIANEPDDWENGQVAEKAVAEITFESQDGTRKRIEYGRWWDKEIPLFLPQLLNVKFLKQTDIELGHPEDLVIAFRRKKGKYIYAYYYTDHLKIVKLYSERRIGKPPIDVTIKISGKFNPKIFECMLGIDDNGQIVFEEKPKTWLKERKNRKKALTD